MFQVRSVNNGLHPVGPLTVANYALNPSMEVPDPTQPFNTRTNLCTNPNFDYGSTGWSATGTNAPVVSQSATRAFRGAFSLQVAWQTSTASVGAVGPSFATVIGQNYTVSAWVYVLAGSPAVQVKINSTTGGVSTLTNQWQRIQFTLTAVGTTTTVQFTPNASCTLGQFAWIDCVMYEQVSSAADYFDGDLDLATSRTNLCTNPSFETNTTGWATAGSPAPTIALSTAHKLFGASSALVTWPSSGPSPDFHYSFTTVVGVVYTVSTHVYIPSGNNPVLLTVSGFSNVGQTSTLHDAWERLSFTFIATATTSTLQILPTVLASGICYLDATLIEVGVLNEYFDGSLPTFNNLGVNQAWTGTAHASTSTQHVPNALLLWTGTVGASTSTRSEQGPKWWTVTTANVTCQPSLRVSGRLSAKLVPSSISLMPKLSQTFAVVDLTNYSISLHVFIPAAITGGGLTLQFDSFDSTNTLIQTDNTSLLSSGAVTVGFIRLATTYSVPAGTSTLTVTVRPTNQPSSLTDVVYIDNFMFEQSDTPSPTYLDGNMAGYVWSGATGESTTLQTEFPDALYFFGTYIWQTPNDRGSGLPIRAHALLQELPWSPAALTD